MEPTTRIAALLPPSVAGAELVDDVDEALLYREELAVIVDAVPKRRREFAAGRVCARRALADLGIPPQPILRGETRDPVWPAGVVGSITHCPGYRAAAVARSIDLCAMGIDAEPHAPLPEGVLRMVAGSSELTDIAGLRARQSDVHWDRLLFSAKESVYKAHFPLHGTRLGFMDVHVTIEPVTGRFIAQADHWPGELRGRWLISDGLVRTAVAIAR